MRNESPKRLWMALCMAPLIVALCGAAACDGSPCEDVTCETPPADECAGDLLRVSDAVGTCSDGECEYTFTDVQCDAPPDPECVGDTLRTYDAVGACSAGACEHAYTETVCPAGCLAGACIFADLVTMTLNPYEAVNWSTWNQYKANFHTHTTNSDGSQSPDEVIDEYHTGNYDILAITDHNHTTWPWTDYGRDPSALGMLAVKGNEYSSSNHMNALFAHTETSNNLLDGLDHVDSAGGLTQINHPGRYNVPDNWSLVIPWFADHPSAAVLEVFNQGDRYSPDRRLWDRVNQNYFPTSGTFVWGTSNDDKHTPSHLYRNFQFMLMPELTEAALETSMRTGAFYFCYEPWGTGLADVPTIEDITVDDTAKTITIVATGYDSIRWIGYDTAEQATGDVFDYSAYVDSPFVRAILEGANGDCFTQPFGFEATQ